MSNRPARVVIADDHPGMLTSLCQLLSPECDVVGTVSDGNALLESVERLQPDVVLADLNMPGINGLDACRQLIRSNPRVKVILLSVSDDTELAKQARAAGASAFFAKFLLGPAELLAAVNRAREPNE